MSCPYYRLAQDIPQANHTPFLPRCLAPFVHRPPLANVSHSFTLSQASSPSPSPFNLVSCIPYNSFVRVVLQRRCSFLRSYHQLRLWTRMYIASSLAPRIYQTRVFSSLVCVLPVSSSRHSRCRTDVYKVSHFVYSHPLCPESLPLLPWLQHYNAITDHTTVFMSGLHDFTLSDYPLHRQDSLTCSVSVSSVGWNSRRWWRRGRS